MRPGVPSLVGNGPRVISGSSFILRYYKRSGAPIDRAGGVDDLDQPGIALQKTWGGEVHEHFRSITETCLLD